MKRGRISIIDLIWRCLRLRCPVCGVSSIVARPFHIKHFCPACNALFKREDGFFVGAIAVSVVTTEFVILVLYVVCLLLLSDDEQLMLGILFTVALVFPIAFYHHGWSIWLSFDHLVETLPQHVEEREE
ncbi:MAG TPA: hypothetical protein VF666_18580 [Pyrinomonadaceae bacterium]